MAYDPRTVARIKGALRAGFGPKLIATITRIPVDTIKEWSADDSRGAVPADESVEADIREALLGRFMGRGSAR